MGLTTIRSGWGEGTSGGCQERFRLRAKYGKRSGIDFRLVALRGQVMRGNDCLPQAQPSITGRDKKAVMNPSRSTPARVKTRPVTTTMPAARVR